MSKYGQNFKDIKYELSRNYKLCKLNDKKSYEDILQTLCKYILKSYDYEKALDKACAELVKLKECADCWEYEEDCPFRNECKEGTNYCYDTRCWKEWLLND